jgi:hypothetical protein
LIVHTLTRLLGSHLAAARDRLWQMATGTVFDTSEQELRAATAELRARLTAR